MSVFVRPGSLLKFTAKDGRFDVVLCIASEIQDDDFCRIVYFHPLKNKESDIFLRRKQGIADYFVPIYLETIVCKVSVLDL